MSPPAHYQKPHNAVKLPRSPFFQTGLRLLLTMGCLFLFLAPGAGADTALPENKMAPAFTLKDAAGTTHVLTEYRGRSVVLCFACGCSWCHAFGIEWAQMQRTGVLTDAVGQTEAGSADADKSPVTLVVFMGDGPAARAYAVSAGLDLKQTVLLPDADLKVTRLYHAMPCPRLYVLDGNGLMRYVNRHADDAPQNVEPESDCRVDVPYRVIERIEVDLPVDRLIERLNDRQNNRTVGILAQDRLSGIEEQRLATIRAA